MRYLGTVIGSVLGFVVFVRGLESKSMDSIIYRNNQISFAGLFKYIKSPFIDSVLWNRDLLVHNWKVVTTLGAVSGHIIEKTIYNYCF